MSSSDEDLLRFIAASFPSVWALELLLLLKREPRLWDSDELVERLRASNLVISKALDALMAAGLVSVEHAGATYLPVSMEVERLIDRIEELYRGRPNKVRRAIVSAGASSAVAFAEAFKLRKGDDG